MRKHSKKYQEAGISPARFKELQGFCLQYKEMQRILRMARAGIVDRREGNGAWRKPDPTGNAAQALADNPAARRVKLIEDCAGAVADPVIAEYILRSVTEGKTWDVMIPPIDRKLFYELRQDFFIELDKRLWEISP